MTIDATCHLEDPTHIMAAYIDPWWMTGTRLGNTNLLDGIPLFMEQVCIFLIWAIVTQGQFP